MLRVLTLVFILAWSTAASANAARCAKLAASPAENLEENGEMIGVANLSDIESRKAIRVCRRAHWWSQTRENKYRLARALISSGNDPDVLKEAGDLCQAAAAEGYAVANLCLGYVSLYGVPSQPLAAAEHYLNAAAQGIEDGTYAAASVYLSDPATSGLRHLGVEILLPRVPESQHAITLLWEFATGPEAYGHSATLAKEIILRFEAVGLAQTNKLIFANVFANPEHPAWDGGKAVRYAGQAAAAGNVDAYEPWIRELVRTQKHSFARLVSRAGHRDGNPYASYVFGWMLYEGLGGEMDIAGARDVLATPSGQTIADARTYLKETVGPHAARIEGDQGRHVSCADGRPWPTDKTWIRYHNGCDFALEVSFCTKVIASLISSQQNWNCQRTSAGPGQFFGEVRDANWEGSIFWGLVTTAIADYDVKVATCAAPLKPSWQNDESWTCTY